jgi:hypothetical protein
MERAEFLVSHAANERAGRLPLQRHRTSHHAERRQIDALARRRDRRDLGDGPAAARNTNRLAGRRPLDQLTQMRLGVGKIDAVHIWFMTKWLVTYCTVRALGQTSDHYLASAASASPLCTAPAGSGPRWWISARARRPPQTPRATG